jgi:hypothetical protein
MGQKETPSLTTSTSRTSHRLILTSWSGEDNRPTSNSHSASYRRRRPLAFPSVRESAASTVVEDLFQACQESEKRRTTFFFEIVSVILKQILTLKSDFFEMNVFHSKELKWDYALDFSTNKQMDPHFKNEIS